MMKLLIAVLLISDLAGRWTLTLDPDFSGNPDTLDCTFKQSGATLRVDCGGDTPLSGDIDDRKVVLRFKTGQDGQTTATLSGVLDHADTTITGKWQLDPDNRAGKFQFKKK